MHCLLCYDDGSRITLQLHLGPAYHRLSMDDHRLSIDYPWMAMDTLYSCTLGPPTLDYPWMAMDTLYSCTLGLPRIHGWQWHSRLTLQLHLGPAYHRLSTDDHRLSMDDHRLSMDGHGYSLQLHLGPAQDPWMAMAF